ncbi:MAG: AAC(3) family N-acetyltransferase, partial [Myxococcota bacterium]
ALRWWPAAAPVAAALRVVPAHDGWARCLAASPDGTLLVPPFTTYLIDPYTWPVPPPPAEQERIKAAMVPFDPATSPSRHMGAVAESARTWPGARRSAHPVTSWVAIGPAAEALLRDHDLDDPEGDRGPVGRAWAADATVVLLGVDHDANTTIHLAESRLEMPHLETLPDRWPSIDPVTGARGWTPVRKTTKCSDGFVKIGPSIAPFVRSAPVGDATARIVRSRDVVAVATAVLSANPTALLCDDPDCVHCPTSRRALTGWSPPAG